MKRLFALILALAMVMSLATTAFAADETDTPSTADTTNLELQGNSVNTRSYKAYMLMSGTNEGDKYSYAATDKYANILAGVLNLTFAADATQLEKNAAIIDAIKVLTPAAIRDFADEVYAEIAAADLEPDATWTGAKAEILQGYWLIVDVSTQEEMGNKQTRSMVMIDTVGDAKVTVTTKDHPLEEHKKTDDENDSLVNPDAESEDAKVHNRDVADYDIGDEVPYNIYTKLPSNVSEYSYFVWEIRDTADKGLTFNPASFQIVINANKTFDVEPAGTADAEFVYEIDTTANKLYVYPNYGYERLDAEPAGNAESTQKVETPASKENGGNIMEVFENNNLSLDGGATVEFNYTCTLNENAVIGLEGNKNTYDLYYSNDPHSDSFGDTTDDINIVLTWKIVVNKIDGSDSKPLDGADFELYKFIAKHPKPNKDTHTEEEIKNLEDGYKASGYVLFDSANAWGEWVKVDRKVKTGEVDDTTTEENEATDASTFTFSGIDDGFYKLVETVVPQGYNKIDDLIFKVKANHVVDWTPGSSIWPTADVDNDDLFVVDVQGDTGASTSESNGTITMNIVNQSGKELPSTGGMGTTLLYITGSVLVLFAMVMLITKKRMSVEG